MLAGGKGLGVNEKNIMYRGTPAQSFWGCGLFFLEWWGFYGWWWGGGGNSSGQCLGATSAQFFWGVDLVFWSGGVLWVR